MAAKTDFDAKLVDLVCANPLLYKKEVRSSPYNLMKKKIELWRSIAASLGVETKYCVTRWKNLKDKYRRELQKTKELKLEAGGIKNATADTWHLLDKMSFLESHLRVHRSTSTKQSNSAKSSAENAPTSWCVMDSEQLIEQVTDEDDPLQEAMEEQQNVVVEIQKAETVAASSTATSSFMKRIETLLEGIDAANRTKAEKRIVAFLCRCQLKSLENQSIDDVVI